MLFSGSANAHAPISPGLTVSTVHSMSVRTSICPAGMANGADVVPSVLNMLRTHAAEAEKLQNREICELTVEPAVIDCAFAVRGCMKKKITGTSPNPKASNIILLVRFMFVLLFRACRWRLEFPANASYPVLAGQGVPLAVLTGPSASS